VYGLPARNANDIGSRRPIIKLVHIYIYNISYIKTQFVPHRRHIRLHYRVQTVNAI
jgi:hypothetical protein